MSWDRVAADWPRYSGKVRSRWGDLSPEDLASVEGRRDELAARIQRRYALERAEVERQIDDWLSEPGVLDDWNDQRPILDM